MIRLFLTTGIVGGLVVAYLTVFAVGPISQLPPPESLLTRYRAEGVLPASKNLSIDETAEELEVFEVPERDGIMLKKILSDGGSMPGMNMSGAGTMNMDGDTAMKMPMDGEPKKPMNMDGDTAMKMPMDGEPKKPMNMDGDTAMKMPMDGEPKKPMNMDGDTAMKTPMDGEPKKPMNMDGDTAMKMPMDGESKKSMKMDGDTAMNMPMEMGEGGILVSDDGEFDREIALTMQEWKFSKMKIDVKMGERIKFTVKNGGQIPHEFMFMSMPLMAAVNYRSTRADWNLVEHKALFEKALVLPGGDFTFVLKVTQPGSWMFMCMLPYHMEMGMMGQMATKGMAMDMKM